MSRLTKKAVEDGDLTNALDLNARFAEFSQSAEIDEFNTRDGAFDLPQFKRGALSFLAPHMAVKEMGWNLWKHSSDWTFNGQVSGLPPYRVKDAAGADDVLSFGPSGFTLENGDLLRVYWDLSVRPYWESGRPWANPSADMSFQFPATLGNVRIFSGYGCWAFWLQWDTTSSALTNFVNVPGQGDFNTGAPGAPGGGELLSNCQSTSVVQSVIEYSQRFQNGVAIGSVVDTAVGWTTADGAWHYPRTAPNPITVYGVRVVFSGPFTAHNNGGRNYLIRADAVADDARLDQQAGSIQALVMRQG